MEEGRGGERAMGRVMGKGKRGWGKESDRGDGSGSEGGMVEGRC